MTTKRRRFPKGIKLAPDATALDSEGEVKYNDSTKKIEYKDDSSDRSVVSEDGTQTLTNKTVDFSTGGTNTITADSSDIIYDNGTSGLAATDAQAAIDEVDGDLDTHIADTSTHGVTGDIVGTTDSQTLTSKSIDADNNTITNIDDDDVKAAAGIDASKIANASVSNAEYQTLNGVTSSIQTQLGDKVDGPASATNDAVARYSGASGKLVKDSVVFITDAGGVSGVTQIDIDNVRINGNTISSTNTNGDVILNPDGTGDILLDGPQRTTGTVTNDISTDSTSGSNVTLSTPTTKTIRLTSGSLSSIDEIPAGNSGQEVILINATGGIVGISDDTGSTAANRILTGTQSDITIDDESSISLTYDGTEQRWMIVAGTGSGSADFSTANRVNIFEDGDAERADSNKFTDSASMTTSLTTTASNVGRGTQAFQFIATASGETAESESKSVPVGYRNEPLIYLNFLMKNDEDVIVRLKDKTNTLNLIEETIADNANEWKRYQFAIPFQSTLASASFEVESTASSTFYTDDIFIGFEGNQVAISSVNITEWDAFTPTVTGLGSGSSTNNGQFRQIGDSAHMRIRVDKDGVAGTGTTSVIFSYSEVGQIDTTKLTVAQLNGDAIGFATVVNNTNQENLYPVFYTGASTCAIGDPGINQLLRGNDIIANARLQIELTIPIVGWNATSDLLVTSTESIAPTSYNTNASQSITNNTVTIVDYEDKEFDDDALVTTGASWKYTAPRSGKISINAMNEFSSTSTWDGGENASLSVYKNTSEVKQLDRKEYDATVGTAVTTTLSGGVVIDVDKDDEIDIRIFQDSGASLTLSSDPIRNYIDIIYVDKQPVVGNFDTNQQVKLVDGVTAPSATVGKAQIYVDTADGDLKIIFGDGTIKTIVTDT
jgi:hypothetical protein